jgi:catechol 2,3-dioxygenase-like lactoylglutathione lyase family enzyme
MDACANCGSSSRADDFDEALAFYRDVVGMPRTAAYEADGGARVAILEAGRATLELANLAQVAFIDGVETDGDARRSASGGPGGGPPPPSSTNSRMPGRVEASARITPWNSLGAGCAGVPLQLTIFQELER